MFKGLLFLVWQVLALCSVSLALFSFRLGALQRNIYIYIFCLPLDLSCQPYIKPFN